MSLFTTTLQKLPPTQAKLCLSVRKFWKNFLMPFPKDKKHKILLALSGGADSTAMAVILALLQEHLGITLSAATINHKLRKEAEEDISFVKRLCHDLNIEIYCREADVLTLAHRNKTGLEETGRKLRYEILEDIRSKACADYIAVAHNADDLCEDVLMRLCRGTGWPGLGGMCAYDQTRKLIRPLLLINRYHIEAFLDSLGIQWQTDTTNQNQKFTRNHFRHTVTPIFHKVNPKFSKSISNIWKLAGIDEEFWDNYLGRVLNHDPWEKFEKNNSKGICLSHDLLNSIPKAARLRLIIKAIKEIKKEKNNVRADTLFAIEEAWSNLHGEKTFCLTAGLKVSIHQRSIYIQYEHKNALTE